MVWLDCRDTLKQECGLCLYGYELDENIGPVEAQLIWTIGKRKLQEGEFYEYKSIKSQLQRVVPICRCGFATSGKIVTEQNAIFDLKENWI